MAQPTNSERIDGLLKATSALDEHMKAIQRDLDNLEKDAEEAKSRIHHLDTRIARIEEALKHTRENLDKFDPTDRLIRFEEGLRNAVKDQGDRLTKLEVKLDHLEKQRSEKHGKTWSIKLAVASALIGSVFTILTQLLSRYLPIK